MEQEIKNKSVFDYFAGQQETYEQAQRKHSEESSKRANYLRFTQDGTYSIRILPLAPVIDADGNAQPMERQGYEYPLRSLLLKINDTKNIDKKGKPKQQFVTVCNAKQVFKNLNEDLIDAYVRVASNKYADDEALVKKLRATSFEGGLKWNSQRCMYVYDMDKRGDGLQILQLSYAQYRELEERKLSLWGKLLKKDPQAMCPISSLFGAYPVEVTRKTEAKTSYAFNIDTVADVDRITEEEAQALLSAPRLPEQIYRYTRYHLEATIAYLQQLDEQFDIHVMGDEEIKECVEAIKMLLPSSDTSHFSVGGNGKDGDNGAVSVTDALDALWDRWEALDTQGLDDKSDDGAALRVDIREFIEDNDLDVEVKRGKTNRDLLDEIEEAMGGGVDDDEPAPAKVTKPEPEPAPEPEPEDDDDAPAATPVPANDEDDDEPAAPRRRNRGERNDDTNEPAARTERRTGRPTRRR